jgi:lysophospholipase L1-like esterase
LPEPGGLREGVEGTGPPLRLLIFGDSAAAGVGASTQRNALSGQLVAALKDSFEVHWKLVARTGATSRDALHTLNELTAEPFDVVVTSLGVNDVTARLPLKEWQLGQSRLISLLERKFAAQHILLSALPPMHRFPALPQPLRWYIGSRALQFNKALARLARQRPGCEFVTLGYTDLATESMATDGFHPGPAVYRRWAEVVAGQIKTRVLYEGSTELPLTDPANPKKSALARRRG